MKIKDKLCNTNENKNHFILAIYLYNPITIALCCNFSLQVPFTFLNLFYILCSENVLLGPFLLFLATILTPGYAIINYIYVLYQIAYKPKSTAKYQLIVLCLMFICYFLYLDLPYNPIDNLYHIYYNYYFLKDTRPNFSFYWVLNASTFIKYQHFSLQMGIVYHFSICLSVMLLVNLVNDKDYKYKPSLIYSLLFESSLIFDTYEGKQGRVITLYLRTSLMK